MKKIAITGGIGSGKSFVCEKFSEIFNIPIYYSDIHAKIFMLEDDVKEYVSSLLGEEAYINGELNKPYIREIFYTDKKIKNKIDKLITKKMYAHFNLWCEDYKNKPYVLFESAIIFEKNSEIFFDEIITITVSDNMRKERVINRDNLSDVEYQLVLNNQISDEIKIKKSNYIIDTTDILELELIQEITKINNNICQQKSTME